MTVEDAARHVKMSWHTVKQIDKGFLQRNFSKPRLRDAEYLAIDEFAYKKGHSYKTVVLDIPDHIDPPFSGTMRTRFY
jgi:transposase